MKKLSIHGTAMALGIAEATGILVLGLFNSMFGWGDGLVELTQKVYTGFAPTVEGVVVGMIWGFAIGFVTGALIAVVYNHFSEK